MNKTNVFGSKPSFTQTPCFTQKPCSCWACAKAVCSLQDPVALSMVEPSAPGSLPCRHLCLDDTAWQWADKPCSQRCQKSMVGTPPRWTPTPWMPLWQRTCLNPASTESIRTKLSMTQNPGSGVAAASRRSLPFTPHKTGRSWSLHPSTPPTGTHLLDLSIRGTGGNAQDGVCGVLHAEFNKNWKYSEIFDGNEIY